MVAFGWWCVLGFVVLFIYFEDSKVWSFVFISIGVGLWHVPINHIWKKFVFRYLGTREIYFLLFNNGDGFFAFLEH